MRCGPEAAAAAACTAAWRGLQFQPSPPAADLTTLSVVAAVVVILGRLRGSNQASLLQCSYFWPLRR